jgi:hypothetical protein
MKDSMERMKGKFEYRKKVSLHLNRLDFAIIPQLSVCCSFFEVP